MFCFFVFYFKTLALYFFSHVSSLLYSEHLIISNSAFLAFIISVLYSALLKLIISDSALQCFLKADYLCF